MYCLLILLLICSYMCDLTSKPHIWCISGFVLKIGYYIDLAKKAIPTSESKNTSKKIKTRNLKLRIWMMQLSRIQFKGLINTVEEIKNGVGVFRTGGHTNEWICMRTPFPRWWSKKTHKDLSWFGQEKALRPAGGESLYYSAPKCLYRGEYKRGME